MRQFIDDTDYYVESEYDNLLITEMDCQPDDSSFSKRDFKWRASIESMLEEKTKLPESRGFNSTIIALEGKSILVQQGGVRKAIEKDAIISFDAGIKSQLQGDGLKYLNFLTKREMKTAADFVEAGPTWLRCGREIDKTIPYKAVLMYCLEGKIQVLTPKEGAEFKKGQFMVLEYYDDDIVDYSIKGDGKIARLTMTEGEAKIVQIESEVENKEEKEEKKEKIKYPRPTFDDFSKCVYLANSKKFFAGNMFPTLCDKWQTPELKKATQTLQRIKPDAIIFLIIACFIVYFTSIDNQATTWTFVLTALDILVVCFVINPLIYLFNVPRPIDKYLKDIGKLTAAERRQREKEIEEEKANKKKIRWI